MKNKAIIVFWGFLVCVALIMAGCGQKAEEGKAPPMAKPPAQQQETAAETQPPAQQQETAVETQPPAEAPKLDLLKIKEAALKEKELLLAQKDELQKTIEEKAAIPMTEQMGAEAKSLMEKIAELKKDIQDTTARYNGNMEQLKEGSVDTSDLEM